MILLWGMPGDGPLDAIEARLHTLGADYRLLDQRDAPDSRVEARVDGTRFRLEVSGPDGRDALDFDTIGAAYLRPIDTARALAQDGIADAERRAAAERVDCALVTWADLTTAPIVNPPAAMAANNSKPYQLRLIRAHGFDVPATLVTTDPAAVRAFAARHGRLIYKSVSGVRSIVNVLDPERLHRLDDVANVPTQFQQCVPGTDVRVHVIGDTVFATEVRSRAHDYRYAARQGEDVELAECALPFDIAARCRRMAAGMRLALAGIDLRRTPDGRWVCFEVNPSPAFVYYEAGTGQPIGDAIARWLISADAQRLTPSAQAQRNHSGAPLLATTQAA